MNNMTNPTRRMAHYLMTLQEYDFVIRHKPSRHILNADGLSRATYDPGGKGEAKKEK